MIEWIISGLVVLFIFWIGYCICNYLSYENYYDETKFSRLRTDEKLVIITLALFLIVAVIAMFIFFMAIAKYIIFGG